MAPSILTACKGYSLPKQQAAFATKIVTVTLFEAVERLAAAITLVEFEYEAAQARPDKRMIIDIGPTLIRTLR
jgi:hypothetical protein